MLSQSKYSICLPVISSIIMTVVVLLLLSTPLRIASPCTRWGGGRSGRQGHWQQVEPSDAAFPPPAYSHGSTRSTPAELLW